ncbi:MAG: 3-methyl-2-oxobutanoate hydroxymethyltransferase [Anaerolineaceae bacterium]|nr:3-methyl-2-oxobutanoate hydroxymethyltransferase [Anaerolineaceae bacterium]
MSSNSTPNSISIFQTKKEQQIPITMVTAYDYTSAAIADAAGMDTILVGDSLGMVMLGHPNTLQVNMDMMIYHSKCVSQAATKAFVISDMPFLSYQVSVEDAVRNAGKLVSDGGVDAVKLEGGMDFLPVINAILRAGIPVMGHLGLTPQSVLQLGGFKMQARLADQALKLLDDAFSLQEAGCFSIVLESIPSNLAAYVSKQLQIPTIGIGAGNQCDGQVLVWHDVLGLLNNFRPSFAKAYDDLHGRITEALQTYQNEVKERTFPAEQHCRDMEESEWQMFLHEAQHMEE